MAYTCKGNIEVKMHFFNKKFVNSLINDLTFIGRNAIIQDYQIVNNKLLIPREFGINYIGESRLKDYTTLGSRIALEFDKDVESYMLNKNPLFKPVKKIQDETIKAFIVRLEKQNISKSGILHAYCGIGKTVMFWKLIGAIKRKTILLFHETGLMNQAIDSCKTFMNLNDDDIGIIQGKRCDYKNRKICFAMVQSLMSREYELEFYNDFGMLLFDEVQHAGAEQFRTVTQLFPAKYRIGVTATPRSRHWRVVTNHFGNILTETSRKRQSQQNKLITFFKKFIKPQKRTIDGSEISITPHVYFINTHLQTEIEANSFPEYISQLSKINERNNFIISYINKALDENRKLLVLSGRKKHLEQLKDKVDSYSNHKHTTALYYGQMSQEELEMSKEADCLFAINNKAFEGFNDPKRDTLLLTLPDRVDIEQAVGRIQRIYPGKQSPLVIDFVDTNINVNGKELEFLKMAEKRNKYYERIGCEVN